MKNTYEKSRRLKTERVAKMLRGVYQQFMGNRGVAFDVKLCHNRKWLLGVNCSRAVSLEKTTV